MSWATRQASGRIVASEIETDSGLMRFLSRVRSWRSSSDRGIEYPLLAKDLKPFMHPDAALERLPRIASNPESSEDAKAKAVDLLAGHEQQ